MQKASLLFLVILLVVACSKSNDNTTNSHHDCNFSVQPITAPADGQVKYEASVSGPATITMLTIKTAAGVDSTINSPTIPFQKTFTIVAGTPIAISAVGTTDGGQIEVKYTFAPAGGGNMQQDQKECGS